MVDVFCKKNWTFIVYLNEPFSYRWSECGIFSKEVNSSKIHSLFYPYNDDVEISYTVIVFIQLKRMRKKDVYVGAEAVYVFSD